MTPGLQYPLQDCIPRLAKLNPAQLLPVLLRVPQYNRDFFQYSGIIFPGIGCLK